MNNSMGLKFDSSVFFLVTQKFSSRIRFFVLFDFTRYFLDNHSQMTADFFRKIVKSKLANMRFHRVFMALFVIKTYCYCWENGVSILIFANDLKTCIIDDRNKNITNKTGFSKNGKSTISRFYSNFLSVSLTKVGRVGQIKRDNTTSN